MSEVTMPTAGGRLLHRELEAGARVEKLNVRHDCIANLPSHPHHPSTDVAHSNRLSTTLSLSSGLLEAWCMERTGAGRRKEDSSP